MLKVQLLTYPIFYVEIAQLVEQGIENPCVLGSTPSLDTSYNTAYLSKFWSFNYWDVHSE